MAIFGKRADKNKKFFNILFFKEYEEYFIQAKK